MASLGVCAVTSRTIQTEEQRQAVLSTIKGLDLKRPWDIEWKRHVEKRSTTANAFYWVVVGLIADDTGNSRDDTHEALKWKFTTGRMIDIDGTGYRVHSTAKMSVEEFSAYLEKVIAFAETEVGLQLPARPEQEGAYG